MIAKLQHPVAVTTPSLVLSVAVGVAASWRPLGTAFTQAAAASRKVEVPAEMKEKGWDFWTIEIDNLARELKEERARLRKQAESLEQRSARLAAEEKEFAKVRAELEAMRRQISERVIEIGADEQKNLRSLAATYSSLTPRAALGILRELDDNSAVKILSLMKPQTVAAIFEEMTRGDKADAPLARRAANLSERLRLMKSIQPANSP